MKVSEEACQASHEMRAKGVAEIATGTEEAGAAETMAAVGDAIK